MKRLAYDRTAHQRTDGYRLVRGIQGARRLHRDWHVGFERRASVVPGLHCNQMTADGGNSDEAVDGATADLCGELVVQINLHGRHSVRICRPCYHMNRA